MPILHANGIDLWYDFTLGSGTPIVLSHGWRGPSAGWPTTVYELRHNGRVLVYDVRGQGRTSDPEDIDSYTMPQYAADLRALFDHLEIGQAHIVGVSQGGMIAAQFACDYPERTRSLVISDSTAGNGADEGPGGAYERTMQRNLDVMQKLAERDGLELLGTRVIQHGRDNEEHYFEFPEPLEIRETRDLKSYTDMSLAAYIGTNRAIAERPDNTARIRELRMPVLIMQGEWDEFRPCGERDHKLIEGSRFVLALKSAHSIDRWRPDIWAAQVGAFIADVDAGRDVAGEYVL
jgi:pimeloyl-ACP methyl ester carboxylesterase